MLTSASIRVITAICGILCIFIVLALSITRQALYAPSLGEQQARANIPVTTRLAELREWPPAPDHPIYPLLMLKDRFSLLLASSEENKATIQLQLAGDRLASSERLLYRKRHALALTTLTKSTKYLLAATQFFEKDSEPASSDERQEVKRILLSHISELERMKQYFSDEQKSILDAQISQVRAMLARLP